MAETTSNKKFLSGSRGTGVRRTHPIRGGTVSGDVFQFFTFTCNLHLSPLAERAREASGRRRHKFSVSENFHIASGGNESA
jgi:hypothetical protein